MPADNEDNKLARGGNYEDLNHKGIKGIKVMKVSPKKEVIKENKISEQPIVNFSENELPTLQPKSTKSESKEIRIKCPHCSKGLYIKRDTDRCIYCKERLEENLVVGLFLRSEELEREKIRQQELLIANQAALKQSNGVYNANRQKTVKPTKKSSGSAWGCITFLILPFLFAIYSAYFHESDSDSSADYGFADLNNTDSNAIPKPTAEQLDSLYLTLSDMSSAFSDVGITYQVLEETGTVIMSIDTSVPFGEVLQSTLNNKSTDNALIWDIGVGSFNDVSTRVSINTGFIFNFIYVFNSDTSNIIYSVAGNQVIRDEFYNYKY